jgi:hypothetical protein
MLVPNFGGGCQLRAKSSDTTFNSGGSANTYGSWQQLITAQSYDIYALSLMVKDVQVSASNRSLVLDIGIDPAGGTSYTPIIEKIMISKAGPAANRFAGNWSRYHVFPYYIPAGSTVAVRTLGIVATSTATVRLVAHMQPERPEFWPKGQYAELIGHGGTDITVGTALSLFTGAVPGSGSWISLGSTSRPLFWLSFMGIDYADASMATSNRVRMDYAWGNASTKNIIQQGDAGYTEDTEAIGWNNFKAIAGFCRIPAGVTLYARGCQAVSGNTNPNTWAIGIGGE